MSMSEKQKHTQRDRLHGAGIDDEQLDLADKTSEALLALLDAQPLTDTADEPLRDVMVTFSRNPRP